MEKLNARLLNWASILDPQTKEQAITTSSMPFIYPHLALMPDAHLGKGATVGSVIPTLGAIIPAAVGVDIGCGMIAVQTQFTKADLEGKNLAELREQIERAIPLSAGGRNRKLRDSAAERVAALEAATTPEQLARINKLSGSWPLQLGSLGSGNHFIEVSADELDRIWFFLHSGSRGVGNRLAGYHIAVAHTVMGRYWITLPDKDLAYLVEGTAEFDEYIADLNWAQAFALANREEMMDRVVDQFERWMSAGHRCGREGRRGHTDQLPPQLHPAGEALGQGRVAVPEGRHLRPGGRVGPHSGLDGYRVLRGAGTGQRARAELVPARGRPGVLPDSGSGLVHD